jgi:hypothetical protein
MKNVILILALFGIFLAWQSCQYEWIEQEPPDPNDTVPQVVSFSADIIPIFERGCNAGVCHGGGVEPDLRAENAYLSLGDNNQIDLVTPENSVLYKKMATGGSMNKYTEFGEPELVLKWIQQGALDN